MQRYIGMLVYEANWRDERGMLYVAVPCRVESFPETHFALLDTAARRCIIPSDLVHQLGYEVNAPPGWQSAPDVPKVSTRLGLIPGQHERMTLTFPAQEGDSLEIEATCFLSDRWSGPIVIGWSGCLERLQFGWILQMIPCISAPLTYLLNNWGQRAPTPSPSQQAERGEE